LSTNRIVRFSSAQSSARYGGYEAEAQVGYGRNGTHREWSGGHSPPARYRIIHNRLDKDYISIGGSRPVSFPLSMPATGFATKSALQNAL